MMLPLCLLLLAARLGVLAELQNEEAACSSVPCDEVNAPMCGYDQTNNLKAYFLNECVFNCSNCLYRKAGSQAKFIKINTDDCLNDSKCIFVHECPSPTSGGAGQPAPAGSIMPFPMFPGPVMFGDANRGQEGLSMGPFLPDIYSNPKWMAPDPIPPNGGKEGVSMGPLLPDIYSSPQQMASDPVPPNGGKEGVSIGPFLPDIYGNPQQMASDPVPPNGGKEGVSIGPFLPDIYSNPQWMSSDPILPVSSSHDNFLFGIPDTHDNEGIDRNELSDTEDSNSNGSDDFDFIAPSFSPYMGPILTDTVSDNDDSADMEPSLVPRFGGESELGDSPGSIDDESGILFPENALQYLPGDVPEGDSDDDLLTDGILNMMDDSPNNDLDPAFPEFQIGPVGQPLLSTDDDVVGDFDPLDDILSPSPSEDDSDSDILAPGDTILFLPSDSPDDNDDGSDDDLLDIISSILEDDLSDDAAADSNPILDSPDESSYIISDDIPEVGDPSGNYLPSPDITFIPQDVLVPLSDDTEVNSQDLALPLSVGGLSGDQGTSDDVILLAMDPLVENADDGDAVDEGSEVLILIPEDDSSAGSLPLLSDASSRSAPLGGNDVPLIQEINFIPDQSEDRGNSGGHSNLLESLLMQKLLFNADGNDGRSKKGNTYIDAKVHVELNVQPDEAEKPSRREHHPRFWNHDRDDITKRPKFPPFGFRDNDVDYTPAARQAALVMTTIGKTAASSSVINTCSVLLPLLVSFFAVIV